MFRIFFVAISILMFFSSPAQQTVFERSKGLRSATYFETIEFYKRISASSPFVKITEQGLTDAGYPLHLVMVNSDGQFDIKQWQKKNKIIVFINNGIHPGEPDGIDASMLLVRDIARKKIILPSNICLAIIPVYNIGGALNRGSTSRANQQGPEEYGFRGNSQNLDLNRDFTKNDSREARSFAKIFHTLDPDIFLDNHVSDGADFQHTMTLISTQYDKLGTQLGYFLKNNLEPALYKKMHEKGWDMTPYVNFESSDPARGMVMFYDPPRYSSGYAALFQTIAFISETHMLKPFKDRVESTYALMETIISEASAQAAEIKRNRALERTRIKEAKELPLAWSIDSTNSSIISFKGYEQGSKASNVTGLERMYYDRSKPYTKAVTFFDHYIPQKKIGIPEAYVIPKGWKNVVDILALNNIEFYQLKKDSSFSVEAYRIEDYKSFARPYEKHHKNYEVKISTGKVTKRFLKGCYVIPTAQPNKRYLVEMLEPIGDDSFFAWNFFDAILQQKEGYSDYRWEDLAAEWLKTHPELEKELVSRRQSDSLFARDSHAQLDFIYKHSPYYEEAHLQYPVFRIMKK